MTLPAAAGKENATVCVDDHPDHHNELAHNINVHLLRADLAPTTPTRTLNTAFQPFPSGRPGWVSYTVRITSEYVALDGETGQVLLQSDANNPPTTVRTRARNELEGTLTVVGLLASLIGILRSGIDFQLSYMVPENHFIRLQTSGDADIVIVDQVEIEL